MRRIVGAIAAACVVACGARTGLRTTGGDDAATGPFVGGVVLKACAPNDGPALDFQLGAPLPSCQIPGVTVGVIILIWNPLPTAPGTFVIGDGSFASGSSGYVCTATNACTQGTGTLILTEVTATSMSGSYTLTTPTGTVGASFEAVTVCPMPEMCG